MFLSFTPKKKEEEMFGKTEKCTICNKSVYATEKLNILGKTWHKWCFKCTVCGMSLTMKNYQATGGDPYCRAHYPAAGASEDRQKTSDGLHRNGKRKGKENNNQLTHPTTNNSPCSLSLTLPPPSSTTSSSKTLSLCCYRRQLPSRSCPHRSNRHEPNPWKR